MVVATVEAVQIPQTAWIHIQVAVVVYQVH